MPERRPNSYGTGSWEAFNIYARLQASLDFLLEPSVRSRCYPASQGWVFYSLQV